MYYCHYSNIRFNDFEPIRKYLFRFDVDMLVKHETALIVEAKQDNV
jgi:hypothetical protein